MDNHLGSRHQPTDRPVGSVVRAAVTTLFSANALGGGGGWQLIWEALFSVHVRFISCSSVVDGARLCQQWVL